MDRYAPYAKRYAFFPGPLDYLIGVSMSPIIGRPHYYKKPLTYYGNRSMLYV